MQEVHTWSLRGEPLTMARTLWMFGFQRRLVRRWEWLMLMPNDGRFPHTSQTAAIGDYTSQDKGRFTVSACGPEPGCRHGMAGTGQAIRAGGPG